MPPPKGGKFRASRSVPLNAPACEDRKSTRLNSSHLVISYAVFCLKKKKHTSELQSPCNLVCRLLLEKKKQTSRPAARRWIRAPATYSRIHRRCYPRSLPSAQSQL